MNKLQKKSSSKNALNNGVIGNTLLLSAFLLCALLLTTAPASASSAERIEIGLQEAITLALAKNHRLNVRRLELKTAEEVEREEKAEFHPRLEYQYNKSRRENTLNGSSINPEMNSERKENEIGIAGLLPWGTQYSIEYSQTDFQSVGIDESTERFFGDVSIEIVHPLLNGLHSNNSTFQRRIARNQKEQEVYKLKTEILNTVSVTANTYATLYFTARNVDITKESLARAERFLKDTKTRVEVGRAAKSDITIAETRHTRRLEALIRSESSFTLAQSRLLLLISEATDTDEYSALQHKLYPKSLPELSAFNRDPIQDSEYALANSYTYKVSELVVDFNKRFLKNEKQNALPDVDLRLGYTQFGDADGAGFDQLRHSFREDDSNEAYVSLSISYPLANQAAKSRISQRRYRTHIAQINQADLKRNIKTSILDAALIAQDNWKRIEITRKALSLAEASLVAEEKKLNAGRSNSFFVLNLQEDVASEDTRHLRAVVDYFKSIVSYEQATLKLLERFNINI